MKRHVLKIGLFLVAGAIINVAVAWTCARLVSPAPAYSRMGYTCLNGRTHWVSVQFESLGMTGIASWIPGGFSPGTQMEPAELLLPFWSRIQAPVLPKNSEIPMRGSGTMLMICGPSQVLVDHAYGLPFRSMRCGWGAPDEFVYTTFPTSPKPIVRGIEVSAPNTMGLGGQALPLGVIWSGFAFNTLAYASLGLVGPALLRRGRAAWRRDRGMCPGCGYDLRETGNRPARYMLNRGCPECGWNRPRASTGGAP